MCESRLRFKDKNGQIQDYGIVLIFTDENTKKQYIVYTDGAYTAFHEQHLHAAQYVPVDEASAVLLPIETDEEMKIIENRLLNE